VSVWVVGLELWVGGWVWVGAGLGGVCGGGGWGGWVGVVRWGVWGGGGWGGVGVGGWGEGRGGWEGVGGRRGD
jgi:hypothetical protein